MLEGNTNQHMNLSQSLLQQTDETSFIVPIFHRRADSIHTETLVAATLFCPAPRMTRTDETQTPKARLQCGPVPAVCSLCAVLCCATVVRRFAVCGLCVVEVSRVPISASEHRPLLNNTEISLQISK